MSMKSRNKSSHFRLFSIGEEVVYVMKTRKQSDGILGLFSGRCLRRSSSFSDFSGRIFPRNEFDCAETI